MGRSWGAEEEDTGEAEDGIFPLQAHLLSQRGGEENLTDFARLSKELQEQTNGGPASLTSPLVGSPSVQR